MDTIGTTDQEKCQQEIAASVQSGSALDAISTASEIRIGIERCSRYIPSSIDTLQKIAHSSRSDRKSESDQSFRSASPYLSIGRSVRIS